MSTDPPLGYRILGFKDRRVGVHPLHEAYSSSFQSMAWTGATTVEAVPMTYDGHLVKGFSKACTH